MKENFVIKLFNSEIESELVEKKIANLRKVFEDEIKKNHKMYFIEALLKTNNYEDFLFLTKEYKLEFFFTFGDEFIKPL